MHNTRYDIFPFHALRFGRFVGVKVMFSLFHFQVQRLGDMQTR
jgi:hypothetical protein